MDKSIDKKLYFVVQGDFGYGDIVGFHSLDVAKQYVEDRANELYYDGDDFCIYEASDQPIRAKVTVEWE